MFTFAGGPVDLHGLVRGVVSVVDGPASVATFYWPCAIVVGEDGAAYVSDNHMIRKISTQGA